jgi:HPt (histidine-containing phosphotransfer) domain-containing protein
MDDLFAKFLPPFLALARSRVEVALTGAERREPATIAKSIRELHTLAGEAGLLGLSNVVPVARDCEKKAKNLQASHAEADAESFVGALRQLEQVIEGIAAAHPSTGRGS